MKISKIIIILNGFFGPNIEYVIDAEEHLISRINTESGKGTVKVFNSAPLIKFYSLNSECWNEEYFKPNVLDGLQWEVTIKYQDCYQKKVSGSNAFPEHFMEYIDELDRFMNER